MGPEELLIQFLADTYTRKDVGRRLRLLREYFEAGYFTADETEITKFLLSKHATTDDINAFMSWKDGFYRSFTKDSLYHTLNGITDRVKKLPNVVLYIPYEAVPAEIIRIGKWFREHVGPMVIVDLRTDSTLLGGCAFVWKGVYRDYSLRYYMRKKQAEITKIISEYVQKFYEVQDSGSLS
jgi:hypothetical protein